MFQRPDAETGEMPPDHTKDAVRSAPICLVSEMYPPTLGGVAGAARRLARLLHSLGHSVHVVTTIDRSESPEGGVESRDEDGVWVHRVSQKRPSNSTKFLLRDAILQLDDRVGFQLFQGFFLPAAHPCLLAVEASGIWRPVIASIRGNDVITLKDHPFHRTTILHSLEHADWITSVNAAYLDLVAEDVEVSGRSSVIRNGVMPVPAGAPMWRLDQSNRGRVGLVGELRKVKDIPLLVRGYNGVPASLRSGLLLAGFFTDPEEERWAETLVQEFGLGGEVTLTGPFAHGEVFDHLRRMHVYVQCSAFEGLPNALLEAASLGVPLVATAVGGMAEVLDHEVSGLLVPHGDPAALAGALARILGDDGLAAALSQGARALAAELSPEAERADWSALYDRLLGQSAESVQPAGSF
ncbi:glycosyltransferase [Poseidonocella sedimentorum]|uniref:Glycosyltransferase involved in cell wall bisynthesis n=1 Tax=Poseidonocella sedimentorum TaxID=871652 RepID=A0A1I6DL72_9RHOB|nr:glycosyltransferase [Poseidonocella sedimentorum]SFR06102.1 Glycosyltransferase involved in cell wall bisynthesis [Poseidonocella sedimentorum]